MIIRYLQLINELGAVDARLAPEFQKLLAGEEKDKTTSKPSEGKKCRVPDKKEKVGLKSFSVLKLLLMINMKL